MALILFLTIDVSGGCSNTGHNPYLELYYLIFVVTEHVFLSTEHENRKKIHCWLSAKEWALREKNESSEIYVFIGGNFSLFYFLAFRSSHFYSVCLLFCMKIITMLSISSVVLIATNPQKGYFLFDIY